MEIKGEERGGRWLITLIFNRFPFIFVVNFLYIFFFKILSLSGGLADEVDEKILNAAFLPFGDIIDVQMPRDYAAGKERDSLKTKNIFSYLHIHTHTHTKLRL